ncbi:MAG: hypothetical protein UX53_C0044G0014 [Candidatus Azambacteria bacterium GW2011_GWB2_46_37]|uniref:Uncharacterized protein n=2 Tax=Candidatus Azamiibacteriota TaxID=1752741 RepID=A0A0G1PY31_9BACT|nr:MAG: hypothetical protein UX53_C0044G0014 [Candidatus Azambacteria bacterium GW2011_GWB2_46_37]KKU38185.1 MAG: hypothetical protein UX51_C0005G0019 [Candidatus Azambacteria bacterium GW2011_GWF2_46_32]
MNTSYTRLGLNDREEISRGIYASGSFAEIARKKGAQMKITRQLLKNQI